MNISYDYYKIFYYVATCHSISKAAAALMCGQPNVTKAIGNLEAQLGCSLFLRTSRGVTLTPEGEQLYAHIAVAYEHILQGETELLSAQALESGTVTIGTTESALHGLLLPVLEKYHQAYPNVRLRFVTGNTREVMSALKNGTVDFGLITTPLDVGSFRQTELRSFREPLCAGGLYKTLGERQQELTVLREYPLISLGRNTATYGLYNHFAIDNGLAWRPDIEVSTADQMLPLIRHGLGIGFVAEFFLKDASGVVEIPLNIEPPRRSICLLEDPGKRLSIAARQIVVMLTETH